MSTRLSPRRTSPNPRGPRTGRRGGDHGRITILVTGLVVLLAAIIGVTASATYVTIQQRHLLALADASANAAADRFEVVAVSDSAEDEAGVDVLDRLRADPAGVRAAAAEYLEETVGDAAGLQEVRVSSASVADDGITVEVSLVARVATPWAAAVIGQSTDVEATARARIALSR